ncbi:MAG: hypothetical protein K0Q55_4075 [Verrucomicrobia bacterium]|nr:hypothetical protein [Verrucomicrobiota bacterium]
MLFQFFDPVLHLESKFWGEAVYFGEAQAIEIIIKSAHLLVSESCTVFFGCPWFKQQAKIAIVFVMEIEQGLGDEVGRFRSVFHRCLP